jgi:sarcosine dehydrogenase
MTVDDVVGAAFLPTDGQASPSDIVQALARGARAKGVAIREGVGVTGVRVEGGRVTGVETDRGFVACETVVNCAGQWAREVGRMAGVNVPLVSVQHQYLVTERIAGVTPDLPTLRDPDRLTYYKEEVGGLIMGGYEPNPKPWAERGIPEGFHFTLLDGDWDHFEPMMELALGRVPALETAGVKQFINGPESFTPDGNFILGEAPEVAGFFVGAGFNAFGIASGGGAGMALAEWVATGAPPYDLWPVDIRRFGRNHLATPWVRTRTLEAYAKHYAMAWPHEEYASGRPLRRSPLYDRLRAKGAVFGEKLGWERPNWFAGPGEEPRRPIHLRPAELARRGRARAPGLPRGGGAVRPDLLREVHDGRPRRRGGALVDRANDVARPPGTLVYTQMLNARGGIECDLTVARLEEDAYYIVTGTGFATHDFHWIRRNVPAGLDARLIDVTSQNAVLSLMGPRRATSSPRSPRRTSRTPPSPSPACAGCRSPARRSSRSGSPTSASSAGSSTCRWSSPRPSTTR